MFNIPVSRTKTNRATRATSTIASHFGGGGTSMPIIPTTTPVAAPPASEPTTNQTTDNRPRPGRSTIQAELKVQGEPRTAKLATSPRKSQIANVAPDNATPKGTAQTKASNAPGGQAIREAYRPTPRITPSSCLGRPYPPSCCKGTPGNKTLLGRPSNARGLRYGSTSKNWHRFPAGRRSS